MDHASPDDDLVHDDAPDLSTPEWQTLFASAPMKRGRPKADRTKISTTIRLDADIVDRFRSGGEGWQSRINSALRQWLETH
jgi:uncharacterized protein (DUF4415 family)